MLLESLRAKLESWEQAGVLADGVEQASEEGTPQGSPLSPLLANVMLDDLDSELERRGHRFVRYADDIMVYVRSERAAGPRPARLQRSLAPSTGRAANRRLRTRMSGGVGGAGLSPAPPDRTACLHPSECLSSSDR